MNRYQSQYGACCESCAFGGGCVCGGCAAGGCMGPQGCEYSGLVQTGCVPPTQFGASQRSQQEAMQAWEDHVDCENCGALNNCMVYPVESNAQFGACGGVAPQQYPPPNAFIQPHRPYCGGCGVPIFQGFYHLPWNANIPGCSTYDGGLGVSPYYAAPPPFFQGAGGQQSVQFGARRTGGLAGDPSQFGGACGGGVPPRCEPRQCSSTTSYTVVPSPQQRAIRPRGAPFQPAQPGYAPCATPACTYNPYDPVY